MPASKGQVAIACAGVVGVFTKQQIALLQRCMPGGIVSQGPDQKVIPILMPRAEYADHIAAGSLGTVRIA